jgi:hypothetical protein
MPEQIYGLFSNTEGPDGNGLFNPSDPALGGHIGHVLTPANSNAVALMDGGFVPPDQLVTVVEATIIIKSPQAGLPTAAGSLKLKGTFIRDGNTVKQQKDGVSIAAELASALGLCNARLIVDTSKTPNEVTVQVKPQGAGAPAMAWQWTSGLATSY